jgi:hypothetical protein
MCDELGARERNLFVVKRSRTAQFLAAVARCSERKAYEVGSFDGDGNELALYQIQPSPASSGVVSSAAGVVQEQSR